jgi:hypothetical protein
MIFMTTTFYEDDEGAILQVTEGRPHLGHNALARLKRKLELLPKTSDRHAIAALVSELEAVNTLTHIEPAAPIPPNARTIITMVDRLAGNFAQTVKEALLTHMDGVPLERRVEVMQRGARIAVMTQLLPDSAEVFLFVQIEDATAHTRIAESLAEMNGRWEEAMAAYKINPIISAITGLPPEAGYLVPSRMGFIVYSKECKRLGELLIGDETGPRFLPVEAEQTDEQKSTDV